MKISILIPCHNEEKSIRKCVQSCLDQTRRADEIIVVDDGSTDTSFEILKTFNGSLKVIRMDKCTGNKSYAQEYGLKFIAGDIFIATDGDTVLDKHFIERIAKDFEDKELAAVCGYVRSLKYNWLTACRQIDYVVGQNFHKIAQSYIKFLMVIPGAAGAFRTDIFRKNITFDHDTLTEDLDFTYKLNKMNFKIKYDRKAIVYTQDPSDLRSYFTQMQRWFAGGWQNILKHRNILKKPGPALELSLTYLDGLAFTLLFFILPMINIKFFIFYVLSCLFVALISSIYAAIITKRADLILYAPLYLFITLVNAVVFIIEFFKVIILRRRDLVWIKPTRRRMI